MPSFESLFATLKPKLESLGHWRNLPDRPEAQIVDFSSNDYLGLAFDRVMIDAGYATAKRYGMGSTGSRLLSGNLLPHLILEQTIAKDKGTDAALIFNSGYQANATVLACLLDKQILGAEPLVFSDRLNHASLHHACQLRGIRQVRYRHNDLVHLHELLQKHHHLSQPKFIVTETVFGMDGDCVDMSILAALADEFDAFLYLDEAHATGILGRKGYGLGSGWIANRGLAMGTFSKALGVCGAYIACSLQVRDYLINRCPGFIYSTALSPCVVGAVQTVWERLADMEGMRSSLLSHADTVRRSLHRMGLDTGQSNTHIIPVIVGEADTAVAWKNALLKKGLLVSVIRPPTVPLQTARLRIALNATHTAEQIHALINAFSECIHSGFIIKKERTAMRQCNFHSINQYSEVEHHDLRKFESVDG